MYHESTFFYQNWAKGMQRHEDQKHGDVVSP